MVFFITRVGVDDESDACSSSDTTSGNSSDTEESQDKSDRQSESKDSEPELCDKDVGESLASPNDRATTLNVDKSSHSPTPGEKSARAIGGSSLQAMGVELESMNNQSNTGSAELQLQVRTSLV